MRITKDFAIALAGTNDTYEALKVHYDNMIKAFLSLESDRTLIINHVVARYIATKFLNSTGLHEFTQDLVLQAVKPYVDCLANTNNHYFLPFKEVARLTYGYAKMFNDITYHEYVISQREEEMNPVQHTKDYFYNIFHGINFISESDYATLSNHSSKIKELNVIVALGMKYVNENMSNTVIKPTE